MACLCKIFKMHYIYKFLSEEGEVLYVGMTGSIKSRINTQHFRSTGHLSDDCYREAKVVVFHECVSRDDAKIRERYLINLESPKYNNKMNNNSAFSFTIDDWHWKYMPIKKSFNRLTKIGGKTNLIDEVHNLESIQDYEIDKFTNAFFNSLVYSNLKCISRYPYEATVIGRIRHFGDNESIKIIMINGRLWCFHDSIQKLLYPMSSMGSTTHTIKMINAGAIDVNDVLLLSDKTLIEDNIKSTATRLEDDCPLFPQRVVLLALSSVNSALDWHIDQVLEPFRNKLNLNGRFRVVKGKPFYTNIDNLIQEAGRSASACGLLNRAIPVSLAIKKLVGRCV